MAENKPTHPSVIAFLEGLEDEQKKQDCYAVLDLMREVTQEDPKLWGSIVGFGQYHLTT